MIANMITIEKIYQSSIKEHKNPYNAVDWTDVVDRESEWFMSPSLISLYGTEYFASLSEKQQKQLSFWEAVNFFSLNIHGEKALIEGLSQRLYQQDELNEQSKLFNQYIHVFLAEENQHMSYFGGFCNRYAKGPYPDRKLKITQNESVDDEDDFLFFVKVLIFEEISDVYNRIMATDSNLNPIACQINRIHHHEETRHLIFGRQVVESLFTEYSVNWSEEKLAAIRKYIANYFISTWAEYYNPSVYKDAGFEQPFVVRQAAYSSAICKQHRQKISERCLSFLFDKNILVEPFML
jgi:hypothetical protein